jgi:hypothetical protein
VDRLCKNCGERLPQGKRSHAIFCNVKCKKQEEHKRRISDPSKREANRVRSKIWRDENLEQSKKNVSEWQKLNRSRCRESSRRYSLQKASACPPWLSESQRAEIENVYWLALDLRSVSGQEYHVDHIIPLQGKNICGLHVPWNLQVLPADLNISKRNHFEDTS